MVKKVDAGRFGPEELDMAKVINMGPGEKAGRVETLGGLTEREKEYACKLIAVLRHGGTKGKALEESIDVLYDYMNYEKGKEGR